MAVLGHLAPLQPLWPVGPLGPFWPNYNEAKRRQRGSSSVPNSRWAYLSQFLPQNPTSSKWPKPSQDPKIGHNSVHGLWQPPAATSSAPRKYSPQVQGNTFTSSMLSIPKDQGVVHIWYNIPLCTIFAQQSNGEIFRTKLSYSKSSTQSITNLKEDVFSYSVWQFPGGYQKTIQGPQPPGPAGVGLSILIRIILREILRGYQ
ncbi:hypothetical protein O181_072149 [Austropuccinia psidii MF-1]|uniref:Uncharacterized protein n=1 Tax=Austropuccinia psidii MF-1 TaxID=1389203 RepID=A0A9Q3IB76_9BASI|nr:hypothetical protein [Austropuccinia psidii MF-1]